MHGTLCTCRCAHAYQCNAFCSPPLQPHPQVMQRWGIFDPSRSRHLYPPLPPASQRSRCTCSRLSFEEAGGALSSPSQVQSGGGAAGDGGGGYFFLKEIFLKRRENAAQLRIGSGGVLSQQLVTQTQALSRVSWSSARLPRLSRSDG